MKKYEILKKRAIEKIQFELGFLKDEVKVFYEKFGEVIESECDIEKAQAIIADAEECLREGSLVSLQLASALLGLHIADEIAVYNHRKRKERIHNEILKKQAEIWGDKFVYEKLDDESVL